MKSTQPQLQQSTPNTLRVKTGMVTGSIGLYGGFIVMCYSLAMELTHRADEDLLKISKPQQLRRYHAVTARTAIGQLWLLVCITSF